MRKIVELKIEETKTVVGGIKAVTVATTTATASAPPVPGPVTAPAAL
jgi:hypothetical protein